MEPLADTAMALDGIAERQEMILANQARLLEEVTAARAEIRAGLLNDSRTATAIVLAADALASAAAAPGRATQGMLAAVLPLIPAARTAGAVLSVIRG